MEYYSSCFAGQVIPVSQSVNYSTPLWTFTPLTPTSISISPGNQATIQYTIRNVSTSLHTLVLHPISGITQITTGINDCANPFILESQQSCTLTLQVQGSDLTGNVLGGPVLCQQGNALQCYQPNEVDSLLIRLIQTPPAQQYTVTPSAGAHGAISPNTVQEVAPGSTLSFTASPNTGYAVSQWLLDGALVQTGGSSYQLSNIQANHLVSVNFAIQQFTLTPSSGAHGSISPDTPLVVNAGSTFPFVATPAAHYQVNHWSVDGVPVQTGGSSYLLSDIQANHSISVDFILQQFLISPSAGSNGSISPAVDQTVNYGSGLSFTATPNSGYTVYQWFLDEFVVQAVVVLGYGCLYQGGYVFAVDDSTPSSGSLGGKVAATTNQASIPGSGIIWSSDATGIKGSNNFSVYGIAETSTPLSPVPNSGQISGQIACNGATDGACNTHNIVLVYSLPNSNPPINLAFYAAGLCKTYAGSGYNDWYLPAICELGPDSHGSGCLAGEQNMITNLTTPLTSTAYWSSTEYSNDPLIYSWNQVNSFPQEQITSEKGGPFAVRCARALTP